MRRKITSRIAAVALASTIAFSSVALYGAQANAKDNTVTQNLKIAVMSDTHYLSPDLIKDTDDYNTDLNSDRKIFTESSAILDEMLKTVKEDTPDVLLITGDLTKDGELECHQELAEKLEDLKDEMPALKVYVVPGNHDVRNSNGKNFNTADGKAVLATRTEPESFIETYSDVTYADESILERYIPADGKEAGSLSYVARPKDGYTIIAIDSTRYSADNTDSGKDEHETSGQISADLEAWILEQIAAAKERGDTVIGMEHHGMIEHFDMESTILPMYLVNDYERISTEFADAGMNYIFTGHMHANDVSKLTTEAGNTLYDIETGSALTYPCPQRFITISRVAAGTDVKETMSCKTVTDLGPITYTNPLTGDTDTISNLTDYAQQHGFSEEMLSTTIGGVLPSSAVTDALIGDVIHDLSVIPVTPGKSLLDYANYIYQCHLAGKDHGPHPKWVNAARENVVNGHVLDAVLRDVLIKNLSKLPDTIAQNILGGILTVITGNVKVEVLNAVIEALMNEGVDVAEKMAPGLFETVNNLLLKIIDSMSNDTNFPEDNDFTIVREFVSKVAIVDKTPIVGAEDTELVDVVEDTPLAVTPITGVAAGTVKTESAIKEEIVNTGDVSTSLVVAIMLASSAVIVLTKKR